MTRTNLFIFLFIIASFTRIFNIGRIGMINVIIVISLALKKIVIFHFNLLGIFDKHAVMKCLNEWLDLLSIPRWKDGLEAIRKPPMDQGI